MPIIEARATRAVKKLLQQERNEYVRLFSYGSECDQARTFVSSARYHAERMSIHFGLHIALVHYPEGDAHAYYLVTPELFKQLDPLVMTEQA